jgi:hypothetical protein
VKCKNETPTTSDSSFGMTVYGAPKSRMTRFAVCCRESVRGKMYRGTPPDRSGPPRKAGRTQPAGLLFGAGFRGHQAVGAVVDDELSVVFAGMLDETVGQVIEAIKVRAAVVDGFL